MQTQQKSVTISLITLIVLIDWIGYYLVYPLFSYIMISPTSQFLPSDTSDLMRGVLFGLLLSSLYIVQFFSAPILGAASDKKGRRKILRWSLKIALIAYAIAIWSMWQKSYISLLISRLLLGISAGNAAVLSAAIADISITDEEKSNNFGLYNMATGIGAAAGPLIGALLTNYFLYNNASYIAPFLCAGAFTLINFILVLIFFNETNQHFKHRPYIFALSDVKRAFALPQFKIICITFSLFCVGWSFYWEILSAFMIKTFDVSSTFISTMYGYGAFWFAIASGLLIRPLVKRFSVKSLFLNSLLFTVASLGFIAFFVHPYLIWIHIPIQEFFTAVVFSTAYSIAATVAPDEDEGEQLGFFQSAQSLAFAISPLIAAPLFTMYARLPLILSACFAAIAAFIFSKNIKKFK